jgi:hypothetical protein
MSTIKTIQLAEFCRCFHVPTRQVRYVLERGYVPEGVAKQPATGNHRQFSPRQAFWLAMVVRVKSSGIKTPLAAQIADCALESWPNTPQAYRWDWGNSPSWDQIDTKHQYYVEIADSKYLRLVSSPSSSHESPIESPWYPLKNLKARWKAGQPHTKAFTPSVILRLNKTEIARVLKQAKWQVTLE